MNITIEQKNGKTVVTCVDEGIEHPVETQSGIIYSIKDDDGVLRDVPVNHWPRQVCVNTMTPYNNWVNQLAEAAETLVNAFHYEGRAEYQFKADMSIDTFRHQLWRLIKKLNEVLKEGDE